MINFQNYSKMTECVIPNGIALTSTNFSNAFRSMWNLKSIDLPNEIVNMYDICEDCSQLTTAVCGEKVVDMSLAYFDCYNLTTAVCGPNVVSMSSAYKGCRNLTTAVCGKKVVNMSNAYSNCYNLTTAVCGPNVVSMNYAYYRCYNLTTAVCGPNVVNMSGAYRESRNIEGVAACGNNVTDMSMTYYRCRELTTATCGLNVINMSCAYLECSNIQGNAYFYSNKINDGRRCFGYRNSSNMLNIYAPANSTTIRTLQLTNSDSLVGENITWTNNASNDYFYNTQYNIYIYPVKNVAAAKEANGD